MKNAFVQLCLVLIGVTSVHAVKFFKTSSIHTRIIPADAAENVWAIQGKDSVKMAGIDGDFYLAALNPGHWQVWVEAKAPYHDAKFTGIAVKPGDKKDLGEIWLQQ